MMSNFIRSLWSFVKMMGIKVVIMMSLILGMLKASNILNLSIDKLKSLFCFIFFYLNIRTLVLIFTRRWENFLFISPYFDMINITFKGMLF